MSESPLLINLVFALGMGLLGAALAARVGQSVVLGYVVAGIVIGPFTPGFVGDPDTVEALADIGVIFLMFAIGAQFSFRDLAQMGKVATVGGGIQVLLIIGLGYLLGVAMGWAPIEALFFGAVLSNSSSTVLTKALGELGDMDSQHGRLALAWSSVQDMSTIVLVVVLSALAAGGEGLWWALAQATLQAGAFLLLAVPLGSRVLPWLFARVAALRNREIFVLTVAGVALGTAYASSLFGISLALGAFVAGLVLGESDLSYRVLGEIMPIRDIFAGVFFVSVGMLINPLFVLENWPMVLVTLAVIVLAKGALSAVITRLAGYSVRTSVLTGLALAQCAEFSFLMARVGTDLGVVSAGVFSLMLAGAALSIILFPNLYRAGQPLAVWLEPRLPAGTLAKHPALAGERDEGPSGHVVICGYDRVGQMIASALRRQRFPFVIIDEDPRLVAAVRQRGEVAIAGNPANSVVLDQVRLEKARVLAVALADPVSTRLIVDYARQVNPRLDIVARTHSSEERIYLQEHGVAEAVVAQLEAALEMTRHTLRRFGVSGAETTAIVQGLRTRAEIGPTEVSMDW
ncbi:MAG: cation:proton antiporter [Chloroflexota bacterium]